MTDEVLTAAAPAAETVAPVATEMKSAAVPSVHQQPQAAPAQEAPAPADGDGGDEAEHEEEASAASEGIDAPDGARKNKGVGKRINELTREKYENLRRAEAAERRVQELEQERQRPAQSTASGATSDDGRPTREQFNYDEDAYIEALTDWKVNRAVGNSTHRAEGEAKAQVVEQRVSAYAEKNPDAWHEAVTAPVNYTEPMLAAMAESDLLPEIGVYLAQNLDEADAISRMSPAAQVKAITRIEDKLAAANAAPAPTARVAPPKKLTNTPPPPKTVQGAATAEKSLDDMTTEERIAHWRAKRATR